MSNQNNLNRPLKPGLYQPDFSRTRGHDTSLNTVVQRIMTADGAQREGEYFMLNVTWVLNITGGERFLELSEGCKRRALNPDDDLANGAGKRAGLSDEIIDWLKDEKANIGLLLPVEHFWSPGPE